MTYWLLTTEYPPFYGGGISTYCYHTAVMLSGKGHQVSVFINDVTVTKTKIQFDKEIRIVRFNPSLTNSSAFLGHVTNISYEFAHVVKQFIEEEGKPDIIESQEYLGIAYYLLQYKYLLYDWCKDVPVLITMHSPSLLYMEYNHVPMYRYPNFWICEMERFCLQAATYIISPSQYMITELEKRSALTNNNITIVPNPFEIKVSNTGDNNKSPDEIIFYGKLTAQKGAFELLAYFKKLWDDGFSKPLYLIGGQDIVYHPEGISMGEWIRKKYKKYIDEGLLKLEQRIKPDEIATRLSNAQIVIVPSQNDNLPYVVLEMMTLGKVVLVSKQGGQTEIVENGKDGFIFDHNNPDTFFQQLKYVLSLSPEQRELISIQAVKKINIDFSYDTIYAKKIKVIENILNNRVTNSKEFPFVRNLKKVVNETVSQKIPNEKLSVVIPYYNMGKYLAETISSIKSSAYSDIEIIIINDGSSDTESIKKLDSYRYDSTIKIIDTVNMGLAAARNLGAATAAGKYLAFLDADDTVSPEYYDRSITVLSRYQNIHFAGCWTKYFGDSNSVWPTFSPEPPLILFHNMVNSSALVYKTESFLEGGLNDGNMKFQGLEDYDAVIGMTEKGFRGVVLPEQLFHYRVRNDSMIRKISKAKKIILYQYISDKHKILYADFASDIFNLATANGTGILLDNPTLDLHLADKMPFGSKISLKAIRVIKKNRHVKNLAYKLYSIIKK